MALHYSRETTQSMAVNVAFQFVSYFKLLLFVFIWSFCTAAHSQEQEGVSIGFGESDLFPSIRLEYSLDSNSIKRDINEIENASFLVKPELLWKADKGSTAIALSYSGDYRSGDDARVDYTDHSFRADFSSTLSKKSRVRANAIVALDHLELGSDIFTRVNPIVFEQVEFSRQLVGLEHIYGAFQAKGQFTSRLLIDNLEYLNNERETRDASRLILRPSVTFSYRLSGDTRSFMSIAMQQVDHAANGRDRTDFDLAFGASWDITGRTGGSARLGFGRSTIDRGEIDTDFVAEVGFYYEPRSFSRFDLEFQRGFFNDGLGISSNVAILNTVDLAWRYSWSSRVYHIATAGLERVERTCSDVSDQTNNFRFEFGIQLRRWLALGFGIDAEQRQNFPCNISIVEEIAPDYEKHETFAFLKLTL